ncbi:alpha/beta fold hydrolase [Rufibacter roseus]|uniref:Alpha/beta fold hydrolase n=1 Tax=Rufibacter roseus TaxID=1567108 RepID=A0ABW2DHH6_9BACT|nr:alpha/beta hydrolase [Rufibacter roseus]
MSASLQNFTVTVGHQTISVKTKGEGTPLVLIHGNSLSKEVFVEQFDSVLADKYRLIAFDFPGHGASPAAKPQDEVYSIPGLVKILVKTVEALGVKKAVFFGHSLGGHVLLEALEFLPQALGIIICGTPPLSSNADVAKGFLPNPDVALAFTKDLSAEQTKTLAATFLPKDSAYFETVVSSITNTHAAFREEMAASIAAGKLENEVKVVEELDLPVMVLHGKADPLVSQDYIKSIQFKNLYKGEVQVLEKASHSPMLEQPEEFNQLLDQFVVACLKESVLMA